MKRILVLISYLLVVAGLSLSQELSPAQVNTAMQQQNELFSNNIGIKFYINDMSLNNFNQNLQFNYTSVNSGYTYTMSHSLNDLELNNIPNVAIGLEESLGEHFLINFFNISAGFLQHIQNWNISGGVGYFWNLDPYSRKRLRAFIDLDYDNISYNLGNYNDTTTLGFIVNGTNVGATNIAVRYLNNAWSLTPGMDFMYRTDSWDYFAGISLNILFHYHEKISVYDVTIPLPEVITTNYSTAVYQGILKPGNYLIQAGVIKEFGL